MASTSTFPAQSQTTHSQSVALPAMAAPLVLLGRFLFALIFLMSAPIIFPVRPSPTPPRKACPWRRLRFRSQA